MLPKRLFICVTIFLTSKSTPGTQEKSLAYEKRIQDKIFVLHDK